MTTLLRLAQKTRSKLLSIFFPCPLPRATLKYAYEEPEAQQGLRSDALVLASQLDGKTFRLPDLWKVFAEWPIAANPHAKRLEVLVDSLLERIITNERKLKALKKADFARLISL